MMQLVTVLFISFKEILFSYRPLPNRVLVIVGEVKVKVNNFLYEIGYNFDERLLEEVNKALKEASNVLVAYDVFNPDNDQRKSMLYCEE